MLRRGGYVPDDVAKGVDAEGDCAAREGHRSGQLADDPRAVLQRPLDGPEVFRAIPTLADDHRAGVVDPFGFGATPTTEARQIYEGGERSWAFPGFLDAGGAADILGSETRSGGPRNTRSPLQLRFSCSYDHPLRGGVILAKHATVRCSQ